MSYIEAKRYCCHQKVAENKRQIRLLALCTISISGPVFILVSARGRSAIY